MGLFGVLLGLALLMWLAYRGWSVLLVAPLAALIAAVFSGEPLLAHWTPSMLGPVGRVSFGPALVSARAELSTSGGGAAFSKLAIEEVAPGLAVEATLMQTQPRPVRTGTTPDDRPGAVPTAKPELAARNRRPGRARRIPGRPHPVA